MADNLNRYDLVKAKAKDAWELKASGRVVATFATKSEATDGGQLEKAVGKEGGTVRIHTEIGGIEEGRTYPRSKDPRKSPG